MQQQIFNLLLGLLLLFQVPLALALRIPKGQTFASYGHTRFLANTLWQPCLPLLSSGSPGVAVATPPPVPTALAA